MILCYDYCYYSVAVQLMREQVKEENPKLYEKYLKETEQLEDE